MIDESTGAYVRRNEWVLTMATDTGPVEARVREMGARAVACEGWPPSPEQGHCDGVHQRLALASEADHAVIEAQKAVGGE